MTPLYTRRIITKTAIISVDKIGPINGEIDPRIARTIGWTGEWKRPLIRAEASGVFREVVCPGVSSNASDNMQSARSSVWVDTRRSRSPKIHNHSHYGRQGFALARELFSSALKKRRLMAHPRRAQHFSIIRKRHDSTRLLGKRKNVSHLIHYIRSFC